MAFESKTILWSQIHQLYTIKFLHLRAKHNIDDTISYTHSVYWWPFIDENKQKTDKMNHSTDYCTRVTSSTTCPYKNNVWVGCFDFLLWHLRRGNRIGNRKFKILSKDVIMWTTNHKHPVLLFRGLKTYSLSHILVSVIH